MNGGTARVTLGPGSVVRANQKTGIAIMLGDNTCILDGGEIRENSGAGVIVGIATTFIMRSGSIRNNKNAENGGGVLVAAAGVFTMEGGTITGNSSEEYGGGVFVLGSSHSTGDNTTLKPGTFNQTGGAISGNTAKQGSNPNIHRETGSRGTNLSSAGSSSSGSSGGSSSSGSMGFDDSEAESSSEPSRSRSRSRRDSFSGPKFAYDWGFYFETGRNRSFGTDSIPFLEDTFLDVLNSAALGLGTQLGTSFKAGILMNVLGEVGIDANYPGLLGLHAGLSYELFPFDRFGVGLGAGVKRARLLESGGTAGTDKYYPYLRAGLLFKSSNDAFKVKDFKNTSLYFDYLLGKGWAVGFSFF